MARRIKVASGMLNIRLHPHTPQLYAEFLEDVYKLRKAVHIRGDRYGMISLINRKEVSEGILTGIVTTCLSIDLDGNWFDTSEMKEDTEDQISKVRIHENMHPK